MTSQTVEHVSTDYKVVKKGLNYSNIHIIDRAASQIKIIQQCVNLFLICPKIYTFKLSKINVTDLCLLNGVHSHIDLL